MENQTTKVGPYAPAAADREAFAKPLDGGAAIDVTKYTGLVGAVLKSVRLPAQDHDDLVGFGYEGLLLAARRYEPGRGVAFATYAWHVIRGAMLDGWRAMTGHSRRTGENTRPDRGDDEGRTLVELLATPHDPEAPEVPWNAPQDFALERAQMSALMWRALVALNAEDYYLVMEVLRGKALYEVGWKLARLSKGETSRAFGRALETLRAIVTEMSGAAEVRKPARIRLSDLAPRTDKAAYHAEWRAKRKATERAAVADEAVAEVRPVAATRKPPRVRVVPPETQACRVGRRGPPSDYTRGVVAARRPARLTPWQQQQANVARADAELGAVYAQRGLSDVAS